MGIESTSNRPQTDDAAVDKALTAVINMLSKRLDQKGRGIFVSSHEILGIITEEARELESAVWSNNVGQQRAELIDIAVAAIFGIVSRDSGKMDW